MRAFGWDFSHSHVLMPIEKAISVLLFLIVVDVTLLLIFFFGFSTKQNSSDCESEEKERKKTQRNYNAQKRLIVAPSTRHSLDFTIIISFILQFL